MLPDCGSFTAQAPAYNFRIVPDILPESGLDASMRPGFREPHYGSLVEEGENQMRG
ncbi:MAG: hypothetical protein H6618_05630 [Deltaproteobacteria bacterium]|nr:hypothetical protein [Deltaproteobacteria bacterium]